MEEDANAEATLIDRWISFDASSHELETFLLEFGDARTNQSILVKIRAEGSQGEVGE